MAIDADIPLKVKGFSLGDMLKDAMSIRQTQAQGDYYGALAASDKQDLESEQTLRDTLGGLSDPYGKDRPATLKALLMADPGKFTQMGKGNADWQRSDTNGERDELKNALEHSEAVGQLIGTAVDQPSYERAMQQAQAIGIDVSHLPPEFDPDLVGQMQHENLSIKDQLEQRWKAKRYDLQEENVEADNSRADRDLEDRMDDRDRRRGLTSRGQDLGSADRRRAQDLGSTDRQRGQDITDRRGRESYSYSHGGGGGRAGGGGASGAVHTATDPKTGRKVQWNGKAWIPAR
jgi:hypothetical protein